MSGLEPDISLLDCRIMTINIKVILGLLSSLSPLGLSRGLWDIDDVSEMTGISKIKEKGCEERLLRLPLSCLLNICYALDKKLVISLQDMPCIRGFPAISEFVL